MTAKELLRDVVNNIQPVSEEWQQRARTRLDTLTKPLGSLGRLEDFAARIVAIRRQDPLTPAGKAIYVFAADHGISVENVSAYPREVTQQMVLNFLSGGAAISVLARLHHAQLHVVDVGVDADFGDAPGLTHRKVTRGSRNMLHEAAMSETEMLQAITVGVELANVAAATGQVFIAVGEMGIGNTTSASVLTCALTGVLPPIATGRGTGISDRQYAHKVRIVGAILQRHLDTDTPLEPLGLLERCGGLEIAAMAGMILAAAKHRLLIIVDGFISSAAAAVAVAIAPAVGNYLFASHLSDEPGHSLLLRHLQVEPILALRLRLGEGTGAALALPILESAVCLYSQMATFASAGVSGASA